MNINVGFGLGWENFNFTKVETVRTYALSVPDKSITTLSAYIAEHSITEDSQTFVT